MEVNATGMFYSAVAYNAKKDTTMNIDYQNLIKEIDFYLADGMRKESAAFLMWYLENYYRLDKQEAIDAVCDNSGDKGVDGIYINESLGTIDVFQAKISQSSTKTVGDSVLKEFYGTLSQFESSESLENLVKTAGDAQVAKLIKRLNLIENIDAYSLRGIFVANIELSSDGQGYLNEIETIDFVGKEILENEYISDNRDVELKTKASFDVSGVNLTTYFADSDTVTYIAPIKSTELVQLDGIEDQSIFDYNVRGPLGNTKVNKGIVRSIKDKSLHKKFPLFHNGITIVANSVEADDEKVEIGSFYVVNGCQSLTTLFKNRQHLSDDLKILTKIIKVPIDSTLASQITEFSNSQNGVKPRDFKSYNPIQIRLQNEISDLYNGDFFFEIKRGELSNTNSEVISNELSGIYLMSFDLKEPWNTHRKYQVFEDAYNKVFARPEVTGHRVVFLHLLHKLIQSKSDEIDNQLIARYSLARFAIIFIVRSILEKDENGKKLILNPQPYIHDKGERDKTFNALDTIISDIIVDLNGEIEDLGEEFDYKSSLRDGDWIKELNRKIVSNYLKLVSRDRINSFTKELEAQ